MKLFGTDISWKWINVEINDEFYSVHFKETLARGIYQVEVWKKGKGVINAKIESTYPPLKEILHDLWRIRLPIWFRSKVLQLHRNRVL